MESSFWELIIKQLIATSWLEWLGTITGFICVYLAARQNIWNWPIAIISVLAYAFLFYEYKLYGDAVLQLYFLATSAYGWYYWHKLKEEHSKPIVSLNTNEILKVIAGVSLLTIFMGYILDSYTDSNVPYADGFCTSLSFIAQFLMTRKVLQNWILWIIVDICYVPLYLYKDLALTTLLYILFLGLAVVGYLDWKKSYHLSLKLKDI
ncbi:nicotinamide riboside transporter PnuC [Daejeonella oryzae]|uniref:nicotinamide riboside transporter PnuC n=1 Tax=Daejeonella oryzae TaxID=1122943 RepID=UPI00041CFC35|nr:nicotinamide riboside transporter PnuC [Daejeonella oryzae]